MKNVALAEGINPKLVAPLGTDMNTAAITGARVGLQKWEKVCILFAVGTATAALLEGTLKQHTAASGGSSKVLSVLNPLYKKINTADVFTKVEPTVARSLLDLSADVGNNAGMYMIEIRGEDLDNDGGYSYVSIDFADSTAARQFTGLMILNDCRFQPGYEVATV